MRIISGLFIFFRILLNSTAHDKTTDDVFKEIYNFLNDVILLNRTLWDKFGSEIEDIQKLAETPIELRHWPRLKSFYQDLVETLGLAGAVGKRDLYAKGFNLLGHL